VSSETHIFDVDHTISRHSTGIHFLYEGIRMGVLPLFPVMTIPAIYLKYRSGRMAHGRVRETIPGLQGKSCEELRRVARECFARRIKHDLFPSAVALIRSIVDRGGHVVLATLSVDIIVEPLAAFLGVDDIIASSFEFDDGICTGRFAGGPMFNVAKRDQVLQFLAERGRRLEDCSFYSDSINDLPLLEAVGHPVAVNPDRKLSAESAARKWSVVSWR